MRRPSGSLVHILYRGNIHRVKVFTIEALVTNPKIKSYKYMCIPCGHRPNLEILKSLVAPRMHLMHLCVQGGSDCAYRDLGTCNRKAD